MCVCAGVHAWHFPICTVLLHTRECWLWTLFLFPLLQDGSALSKYAKKILLSSKPAPVLESPYKGTSRLLCDPSFGALPPSHALYLSCTSSGDCCTIHTCVCFTALSRSSLSPPPPFPSPPLPSPSATGRDQFQLGSLSYYINAQASGYIPLPDFPQEPPDSSVREVDVRRHSMGLGHLWDTSRRVAQGTHMSAIASRS